jgi:hypothetical protein
MKRKMLSNTNDDYYTDDGFSSYEITSIDPGPWMLIGICIYSLVCVLVLPILVFYGRRRNERRLDQSAWDFEPTSNHEGLEDRSIMPIVENIEVELCEDSTVDHVSALC